MQGENEYLYNSYDVVFAVDRRIVTKFINFLEFVRNENALARARTNLTEINGNKDSSLTTGWLFVNPVDEFNLRPLPTGLLPEIALVPPAAIANDFSPKVASVPPNADANEIPDDDCIQLPKRTRQQEKLNLLKQKKDGYN